MHLNLRTFIDSLRREKDLIEIQALVNPALELAEVHRRVIARGGPALLFTNVGGSKYPVATNLFGTPRRVERAFGPRPRAFMRQAVDFAGSLLPPRISEIWKNRTLLLDGLKIGTCRTRSAPVLEVTDAPPRLDQLPILTTWQDDGGPFITLPLVYTQHPITRKHNLAIYRLQRHDNATTGIHWQINKGGGFHYYEAERLNQPLPVTVYLGGPPALILAAIAPLPEDVPELLLASLLMGQKIKLSDNPLAGHHPLVAEAEFALCGHAPPYERRMEGPFGDHYGYNSLMHEYPVFKIDRIFHRRDAIYPATVVGKPRQEDYFIGDYLQELLSPLFPLIMPGVCDLWSYGQTGFHSLAAAVVKERYPREALAHGFRILGEGQLSLTKFLILTDTPQDLRNFRSLLEHVLARTQWESDLFIFANVSMDTLDYTSGTVNRGSKSILLGLGEKIRELPREFSGELPVYLSRVVVFCGGCLVVEGAPYIEDHELAQRITQETVFANWPLIVVHDDANVALSENDFLWATWTRFEPAADIYASSTKVVRHHLSYQPPIVIDARMKPGFPNELNVREDIARLVDRRWREYFPSQQSWEN